VSFVANVLDWLGLSRGGRYGMGHRVDILDPRDFHVDELLLKVGAAAAVPTYGSADSKVLVVKDQLDTSSCEGQALANGLRAAYLAKGIDCPDLSALFVYYGSRANLSPVITDDGAYIREGIKVLQKIGECPDINWPFIRSRVNKAPSWTAFQKAIPRRGVRGYYAIPNGDVDRIKRTLAMKIPVTAGWLVDEAFMDDTFKGIQGPCTGKAVGGHAMTIVSFEKDTFKVLNSWGTGYREGGRFRASADFIATCNSTWALDVGGAA
jgi:hypothetical protein